MVGRAGRAISLVAMVLLMSSAAAQAQGRRGSEEGSLLRDAAALESRGDYAGAEAVLRRLLEVDPASSGGLFALERVLRAKGETEKILPVVDAFLESNASSSGVRYLKLRVLMDLDSLDGLEDEANRWFESDAESEVPYREVAHIYERAFGADRALEILRRGRSATGRSDALALEMGDLLAATGAAQAAVDEWVKAVGDDGAQAAAIARRLQDLPDGGAVAGRRLVDRLADSGLPARLRAAARIALDVGLEEEALDLSRRVASDLDGRARESFLSDVAQRAHAGNLVRTASWVYAELGQSASSPSERRQFDQRITDVALAAGDTAAALEAQQRVAESFSPGSVDRRRATAQVIRLESAGSDPARLGELLRAFRDEFPSAPELDDLAAAVAAGLQARGDAAGAAAVLEGIEGPQSGLERAYLLLDAGEIDEGRSTLLIAIMELPPTEATEVIQFASLMGRLSEKGSDLLARVGVMAHRGMATEAAAVLVVGAEELERQERAPLLAEAARIAARGGAAGQAASIRERIISEFPAAPEVGEAALALARYRARTPEGVDQAITILEELITSRPNAAVVPDARLELERLRGGRR